VLINIVGGPDLKMREIQEAASLVQEQAHEDANIIFGASIDETLGENVKVTVIATGFDSAERELAMEVPAQRQTLAPQTIPSGQPRSLGSNMRPSLESAPAPSARRPVHAHEARTHASYPSQAVASSQQRPTLRERPAQDAFPNLDHDWDVPAFQRKQR